MKPPFVEPPLSQPRVNSAALIAAILLGAMVLPVEGQELPSRSRASRYLTLDHWAYEYLQRLRERGYLSALNPLVQPYRRMELARLLERIDPDTLEEPVRGWVRMLKQEFGAELELLRRRNTQRHGFSASSGFRASTSDRLDPARALGDGGAWPWWRGGAWVELGPIAAETRLYGDTYFRTDPDGTNPGYDPRDRRGGRTDNAYLSVRVPFGSLELGRLVRNWGAIGTGGLMISSHPTPYPSLGLELGAGRFTGRVLAAELDTVGGAKRHLVAHQLSYASPNLALSFGEATLYVYPSPLLRFLNPVELLFFDQSDDPQQNLMLTAQAWARRGSAVLYVDLLLDDLDLSPTTPEPEPAQYAFTVGVRLAHPFRRLQAGAEYQQVGAWTYRTPNYVDRYAFYNRGLGANYSDYDRLTLSLEWYAPVPGLWLTPALVILRQGEGDFRDSIPGGYYWGRPTLFFGVKERTLRVGLGGRFQPLRQFWAEWDVGTNFVRNKDHVAGLAATEFHAVVAAGVGLEFP